MKVLLALALGLFTYVAVLYWDQPVVYRSWKTKEVVQVTDSSGKELQKTPLPLKYETVWVR